MKNTASLQHSPDRPGNREENNETHLDGGSYGGGKVGLETIDRATHPWLHALFNREAAVLLQMIAWIGFTIWVGSLFGSIATAIVHQRGPVGQTAQT